MERLVKAESLNSEGKGSRSAGAVLAGNLILFIFFAIGAVIGIQHRNVLSELNEKAEIVQTTPGLVIGGFENTLEAS